jgi:hypothetical protein
MTTEANPAAAPVRASIAAISRASMIARACERIGRGNDVAA